MFAFLNKLYPYRPFRTRDILTYFLIGCFTALFLLVFEPFEISLWHPSHKLLKIAGFGFVSFIVPLLYRLCTTLLRDTARLEECWKVRNEILNMLLVITCIALGNLTYAWLIGISTLSFTQFLGAFLATVLVAVFPVSLMVFSKYQRFLKLNQQQASYIESSVQELQRHANTEKDKTIQATSDATGTSTIKQQQLTLLAENEKDTVSLQVMQLLYVESADNYATLVYTIDGKPHKQLIRSSLKRLESQIQSPYILRCHRSFLLNLLHAGTITGNAQGYRATIKNHPGHSVPISRNYSKEILDRIKREDTLH